MGQIYKEKTLQEILDANTVKNCEPKKKKKAKKNGKVINGDLTKTISSEGIKMDVDEKENEENEKIEVDVDEKENEEEVDESPKSEQISLHNLPESIKEMIPVDKIIKSNEIFSPEKQVDSPVTPIQVRKCPRVPEELKDSSEVDSNKTTPAKSNDHNNTEANSTTPKASSKTPNRIEIRRYPRTYAQIHNSGTATTKTVTDNATNDKDKETKEESSWPKPIFSSNSPMERKLQQSSEKINSIESPKMPRRVEFHTIAPKSKKKLL